MTRTCIDCGRARGWVRRGLCNACYLRHRTAGTLNQFPASHPYYGTGGHRIDWSVDEAVVERILGGDWRLFANPAERAEICRRWSESGGSLNELNRLTGWRPSRYYKRKEAA